jgi:hypothetical protein
VRRRSWFAGLTLLLSAASVTAQAEPGLLQARDPAPAVPLGSFESAGIAVFVRAHEARRQLPAARSPTASLAYAPVATGVSPDGLDASSGPLEVEIPATTGSTGRTRWVVPGDQPARPGALTPGDAVQSASPFSRSGLLEAHRTPDLEIEVSKRTTLGVFGEANTIEPTDIRNSTVRATRDLGAGVTLQYRFGE